jgi:hypothetical protein
MSQYHFQHYWDFDNHAIINLKTRKMIFEAVNFRVVSPLYPSDYDIYVEPVLDSVLEDDVNQVVYDYCARGRLCEFNCRWSTQLEEYQF